MKAEEKADLLRHFRKVDAKLQTPKMVWYPDKNAQRRDHDMGNIQNTLPAGEYHDWVFDSLRGMSEADKDDRRSYSMAGFLSSMMSWHSLKDLLEHVGSNCGVDRPCATVLWDKEILNGKILAS